MGTRYHCPHCKNRDKTFVRYIDSHTGEHVHPSVGRCNRAIKCGYHYSPRQYFHDHNIPFNEYLTMHNVNSINNRTIMSQTDSDEAYSLIPVDTFKKSLIRYEINYFLQYLILMFGVEFTEKVIGKYYIGTSKHWDGATVFWQIDINYRIRTGKIMLYDPATGKRVKNPDHVSWVHRHINQSDFELNQCLFGEHLLKEEPLKDVAIVESEKTAIIASIYWPQYIWLATGGLSNFSMDILRVLKGRNVTFFPDAGCFELWRKKTKLLSIIAQVTVSDLLERKATKDEKKLGWDLADLLLKDYVFCSL